MRVKNLYIVNYNNGWLETKLPHFFTFPSWKNEEKTKAVKNLDKKSYTEEEWEDISDDGFQRTVKKM